MGTVTIRSAVISALFAWAGFVRHHDDWSTMRSAGGAIVLLAIDAGHWLVVLVLMGVVIGWMGV